ncbi:TIGR03643 family protein [Aquiflexum balticum DSM 16537]|uniref:TIGR03643 family protein n=1 Tax=Aquiflexum balticum DSM 16537 TaxID=758820 RepID=A0A1W2H5Q0_9BACT|nr:TIGR03643 family protein [Aquiflexum balticum]SMD43952.1 TIGR03643 family protein [Aquiflexum balticum DSM 16537]
MKKTTEFATEEIDRIIEMAWEDRTPFDAIEAQFGIPEKEVISLMRREMKESSFKMWRKRVQGRSTKHKALSSEGMTTFKSRMQKGIALNKISKR